MAGSPKSRTPGRRAARRSPSRHRSPLRTHSKRLTLSKSPRTRRSPRARKSPRHHRRGGPQSKTHALGLQTLIAGAQQLDSGLESAMGAAGKAYSSMATTVGDAYDSAVTRGAMAMGALAGNKDAISNGLKNLERLSSRVDVDGDAFYDADEGSAKSHREAQSSRQKVGGDTFYDSDDGSRASPQSSVGKAAMSVSAHAARPPVASALPSGAAASTTSSRLSDPAAIWNTYIGQGGQEKRSGHLLSVRRAQEQRMLIKTASEVRKLSESLENINDVLYHTGKRRARLTPLDAPMTNVFGSASASQLVRLILPPTLADDTLHVARLFKYIMVGEKSTLKSFVTHLRAFFNMNKTSLLLRTDVTPKSPRSGEEPVSVRSLDTTRNELYVLLGIYQCNVLLVVNRTGTPNVETLRFVHEANNWIVLYLNKQNHIEIVCEKLEDDVIRVVFSPENPLFESMMHALDFNHRGPRNIFSTRLLLAD